MTEYMSSLQSLGEVVCTFTNHVFAVAMSVSHNIKVTDDKETSEISGVCGLPNGELLLADKNNAKLKLLNTNYEVIAVCDVPKFQHEFLLSGSETTLPTYSMS